MVEDNEYEGYTEIAEPVGVIAGVTPVTNPTSTTMFILATGGSGLVRAAYSARKAY